MYPGIGSGDEGKLPNTYALDAPHILTWVVQVGHRFRGSSIFGTARHLHLLQKLHGEWEPKKKRLVSSYSRMFSSNIRLLHMPEDRFQAFTGHQALMQAVPGFLCMNCLVVWPRSKLKAR